MNSVQSGVYANLQNVIDAAKRRTATPLQHSGTVNEEPVQRQARSVTGGALYDRLYGAKTETKMAESVQVGTRFDRYA